MDKYSQLIDLGIALIQGCNTRTPNLAAIQNLCGITYEECRQANPEKRPVHDITDDNPSEHLRAAFTAVHAFADKVQKETGIDPIRITGSEEEHDHGVQILRAQASALASLYKMQIEVEHHHKKKSQEVPAGC